MNPRTQYHNDTGHEFLAGARAQLAAGDLLQASEKGWGAAAQMVKAVAEARGWRHNGHRELHLTITRLSEEAGDERLRRLFAYANSLHTNFYEGWLTRQEVETGLDDVAELVETLDALLA